VVCGYVATSLPFFSVYTGGRVLPLKISVSFV